MWKVWSIYNLYPWFLRSVKTLVRLQGFSGLSNMFLKGYPLEAKTAPKNWNYSVHISWARLASFCHLGFISDPLIISKFHNETHDPKWQENKIDTIVKGRETFYRRHTVPVTSCCEVKYVLKMVSLWSKDCTKELKLEWAYFLGQTS